MLVGMISSLASDLMTHLGFMSHMRRNIKLCTRDLPKPHQASMPK